MAIAAFDQPGRWPLWLPVALGTGAALYFALDFEPPGWAAWAGLLVALTASAAATRWRALALLSALALGFALAKFREERVAAPVLAGPVITHLAARIDAIEPRDSGLRLVLSDPHSGALGNPPLRMRVALRDAARLAPGDWVSLVASLQPPPAPVEPGANDPGRAAFFRSIGVLS